MLLKPVFFPRTCFSHIILGIGPSRSQTLVTRVGMVFEVHIRSREVEPSSWFLKIHYSFALDEYELQLYGQLYGWLTLSGILLE